MTDRTADTDSTIPPLDPDGRWASAFPLPEVWTARGPKGGWYVAWGEHPDVQEQAMLIGVARTFARRLLAVCDQADRERGREEARP